MAKFIRDQSIKDHSELEFNDLINFSFQSSVVGDWMWGRLGRSSFLLHLFIIIKTDLISIFEYCGDILQINSIKALQGSLFINKISQSILSSSNLIWIITANDLSHPISPLPTSSTNSVLTDDPELVVS